MSVSLRHPPIDEVVIGFFFPEVAKVDPVMMGVYWSQRMEDFGSHELKEPVIENPDLLDMTHVRTWLVSRDEAIVLQAQRDRIYVNWRRRGAAEYPGFTKAFMPRAVEEFRKFETFCSSAGLAREIALTKLDVAKIDLLSEGVHWKNVEELAVILPVLAPALSRLGDPMPGIAMKWNESYPGGQIVVTINPMQLRSDPAKKAVKVETRVVVARTEAAIEEQLASASEALNSIFAKIVVAGGG